MDTIKPLTDGEFGVSLKEDAGSVKYHSTQGEVELHSTWVKAKWTRASLPVSNQTMGCLKRLGGHQLIDITSSGVGGKDFTVRNDVDDKALLVLLKNGAIRRDVYEYFLHSQVDEIIFLA
jgi:hypothetical protein